MSRGIALLVLLVFCSAASALDLLSCRGLLAQIFYWTDSGQRAADDIEFVTLYGNDDCFAAWVLARGSGAESPHDLLLRYKSQQAAPVSPPVGPAASQNFDLTNFASRLPKNGRYVQGPRSWIGRIFRKLRFRRANIELSNYDIAVLSLRRGDTVTFGAKTFKLGKFLGAGNATHIFELADYPDQVIRIPFLTERLARRGYHPSYWLKRYVAHEPKGNPKRSVIIESASGYVIAKKIHGDENGQAFLRQVHDKYDNESPLNEYWEPPVWKIINKAKAAGDFETADRLEKLNQASPLYRSSDEFSTDSPQSKARQYIWDERAGDWFETDWE